MEISVIHLKMCCVFCLFFETRELINEVISKNKHIDTNTHTHAQTEWNKNGLLRTKIHYVPLMCFPSNCKPVFYHNFVLWCETNTIHNLSECESVKKNWQKKNICNKITRTLQTNSFLFCISSNVNSGNKKIFKRQLLVCDKKAYQIHMTKCNFYDVFTLLISSSNGQVYLHCDPHDDSAPQSHLPRRFCFTCKRRGNKSWFSSMIYWNLQQCNNLRYLEKFEQIICGTALCYHRHNDNQRSRGQHGLTRLWHRITNRQRKGHRTSQTYF